MTISEDWDQVERHIVDAWSAGEVSEALSQIENVLSWDNHEFRGRALFYPWLDQGGSRGLAGCEE